MLIVNLHFFPPPHLFIQPQETTNLHSLSINLPMMEFHINGSNNMCFCVCANDFFHFSIMLWDSLILELISLFDHFLLSNHISVYACICLSIQLIHIWIIFAFCLLRTICYKYSCAHFCMDVHFHFWLYGEKDLPSQGNSMFKVVRSSQIVFQSGYTMGHSQQQCMTVSISSHPCQILGFVFLITDCLFCKTRQNWNQTWN